MVNYYFFKTTREENASRQTRRVAKPIPGQFTYFSARENHVPLDTNLKVQFSLQENTKVVHLPSGMIIGVAIEGDSMRTATLRLRQRNDMHFYATGDVEVFLVDGPAGYRNYDNVMRLASGEMESAYMELMGRNQNNAAGVVQNESATAAPQQSVEALAVENTDTVHSGTAHADADAVQACIEMRINQTELQSIEDHIFSETGHQRETLGKLLIISQIRDRARIGVVKFSYEKQDGEIRVAYGTRNSSIISALAGDALDSGRNSNGPDGEHFSYFDVQRRAWRCFCTENVQSVSRDFLMTDISEINNLGQVA